MTTKRSYGSPMRLWLLDDVGLSPEQAGCGARWAVGALLGELERNPAGPIE